MAEHIDSQAEAERAHKRHPGDGRHRGPYDKGAFGHADHANTGILGVGMDGIDVSPEQLAKAKADLEAAKLELQDHMAKARNLHGPLGDGHGPVAKTMAATFLDRASLDNGGLLATLQNYHDELTNVCQAIQETLDTYQMVDTGVAEQLNAQGGGQA